MDISLEKLQQDWQQLDHKVDNLLQLNTAVLDRLIASRQSALVKKHSVLLTLDFLFNGFLYLVSLRYLGNHFGQWTLFLPVFSFHLLLTLSLIRIFWIMHAVSKLDWQLPVVEVKRRYARIGRISRWFALSVFSYFTVMHTPILFWLVEEFGGYNMYVDSDSIISGKWVISQWLFTTAFAVTALYSLLNYKDRPWMKALISESAGFAFLKVEKELRDLEDFERDS